MSISEHFRVDNITVTVEWTKELSIVYTTKVSPLALVLPILTRNTAGGQLILQYNTEYNLSVMAVSQCTNVTAFVTVTLNYGKMFKLCC